MRTNRFRPRFDDLEERLVPTSILFFGNSYTDRGDPSTQIPSLVRDIAVAAGQPAPQVAESAPGGWTLAQHAAAQTPTTVKSLIPYADYSVFQGQSQEAWSSYLGPGSVANLVQGAKDLGDDVRGGFPSAKIILYETWARPAPDPSPDIYPTPYATPNALQAEIFQGYSQTLASLQGRFGKANADMAPAGEAFKNMGFNGNLYNDTGGHPTPRGALAAALTIYGTIYEDNTVDIPSSAANSLLQSRGLTAADWDQATHAADLANGQFHSAQNQKFIQQLYPDLLGRTADASGLNYYLTSMTNGTLSRAQVVDSLLKSDEYLSKSIDITYRAILGRSADSAGMNYFLAQLRAGASLDAVNQALLSSDEFYAKSGGTSPGFVNQLYLVMFNRSPDGNYWVTKIDSGMPRSLVVQNFINSRENRTNQVNTLYTSLLRRSADSAGLNYYVGLLQNGTRIQDVTAMFARSDEYYLRA